MKQMKLSEMKGYISKAEVPFLILTAQQVHDSIDTWSYHGEYITRHTRTAHGIQTGGATRGCSHDEIIVNWH